MFCLSSISSIVLSAPIYVQKTEIKTLPTIEFRVLQIVRPDTRLGKNFNQTPRDIYLYASRPPLDEEKSETSSHTWIGKRLKVYRLETIDAGIEYPSLDQRTWMAQLKAQQAQTEQDQVLALEEERKQGSPIDLEKPALPSTALESQDDDDEIEINALDEDQICGHENEKCCVHAKKGPCILGLVCQENLCTSPPPPCGSLDQRCCEEAPNCVPGLMCRTDENESTNNELCLLLPQKPTRKKILVGVIRIVDVQGRLIHARVVKDALQKKSSSSIFAISIRDLAEFN